ncbi:hypothetical protein KXX33_000424 [Aspergillus fumigatus]|nr:hypothetical protein KXX48_009251 [Aspergillus fumigatus]KAH1307664.1 hypothetical protein KXX66_002086 [Aspergillus fumigatus]KAH1350815.1 hypothetical protein KXX33_000424 [Aspergillus fumigatus]KAH1353770.1 hypothetical protein KXX63_001924 [Aspergillus fumigatus]KAH1468055.1 hypothetical protein KXX53_001343 [Aspergillus fumigatus]
MIGGIIPPRRESKDKCDGLRPSCSACRASGQTCSYDPHAKKRGLPEGYVRGLEKLWALSICNIDGFEDTMLALLGTTPDSAGRRDKLLSMWMDDSASETLHESWKTSRLYGTLEKMLSHSDMSSSHGSSKRPRDDNDTGALDSTSGWGFRLDCSSTPLAHDAPRVLGDGVSVSQTTGRPQPLKLPPQTSQLLDTYFAVTHSWFPIVAKHNILRASYLYASAPLSVESMSPGSGDHAALWAVLSYTVSHSRTNARDGAFEALATTKEYYTIARGLIPSETARYELGHVQALLLLTLVNIGLEDWTAAWLLSGQAVRMAISMNLGTLAGMSHSDELRQGKAVFLGCFVVDSLLSFRIARRPCMHPRDLTGVGLLEEDGLEEWNSWADVLPSTGTARGRTPRRGPLLTLSCFNRLVELASVLNRIARDAVGLPNVHTFAQQLVLELKQWDDRLPLGCRLIGPESIYPERHSSLLPHQSYLGLTYVATLLWLYLRIVPQELDLHRSQRPAIEGAKKLLFRALPMITQHLENFPTCTLPPIFEFSLRTIAEQASVLQSKTESDTFPFARWAEALIQRTQEIGSAWPLYRSLNTAIEKLYRLGNVPGPSLSFQPSCEDSFSRNRHALSDTVSKIATTMGAAPGTRNPPDGSRTHSDIRGFQPGAGDSDSTSTILGISIPVDTQYMTPKDTTMDTDDLSMLDISFQQQTGGDSSNFGKSNSTNELGAALLPSAQTHPHPPTPDSSSSNPIIHGKSNVHDWSQQPGPNSSRDLGISITDGQTTPGDIDAIFKDLAYLDTTDWATSREAGLKDFGFLDDSTFHAFCHDPDRLVGSQPLLHPPSIADIWPPPGFFPETFQESTDDVES